MNKEDRIKFKKQLERGAHIKTSSLLFGKPQRMYLVSTPCGIRWRMKDSNKEDIYYRLPANKDIFSTTASCLDNVDYNLTFSYDKVKNGVETFNWKNNPDKVLSGYIKSGKLIFHYKIEKIWSWSYFNKVDALNCEWESNLIIANRVDDKNIVTYRKNTVIYKFNVTDEIIKEFFETVRLYGYLNAFNVIYNFYFSPLCGNEFNLPKKEGVERIDETK